MKRLIPRECQVLSGAGSQSTVAAGRATLRRVPGGSVLDEIAKEYQGKLKICKMDVDVNVETGPKYGVRGIPTLIVFKNGDVAGTKVGALSKSQLAAFIDSVI